MIPMMLFIIVAMMSRALVIRVLRLSRVIIIIVALQPPPLQLATDLLLVAQNGRQGSFFSLLMGPLLTIKAFSIPPNMVMDIIPL